MGKSYSSREPPPAAGVWDEPLDAAPLAFVNLEMTGLDAAADRVVQLCVERVVGGQLVQRMCTFVRPEDDRAVSGSKIHGITAADVADAPRFADLADPLARALDGAVLVAHGARWDVSFLEAEMGRAGRSWSCGHWLCTLALSRRAFEVDSHRLSALAEMLSIPSPTPHRADNDVAVTRQLFAHLAAKLAAPTARALWQIAVKKPAVEPAIVAAAQRAAELQRPVLVCYRAAGRAAKEFSFFVKAVRTDLDPPVVLGYLQRTRGRRELRADRIVRIEMQGP